MIYYATASHKMISGGTIVLMDSTGRIDGYFGHHCSKSDGGTVGISSRWHLIWRGGDSSFEKTEDVRQAFDHTFSHQNTEQIAAADRD